MKCDHYYTLIDVHTFRDRLICKSIHSHCYCKVVEVVEKLTEVLEIVESDTLK